MDSAQVLPRFCCIVHDLPQCQHGRKSIINLNNKMTKTTSPLFFIPSIKPFLPTKKTKQTKTLMIFNYFAAVELSTTLLFKMWCMLYIDPPAKFEYTCLSFLAAASAMPTPLKNLGPVALRQSLLLEALLKALINSKNSSTRKTEHTGIQSETHSNSLSLLLEHILKMKANDA